MAISKYPENPLLWARSVYWEGVRRVYQYDRDRKRNPLAVREDLIQELAVVLNKIVESYDAE